MICSSILWCNILQISFVSQYYSCWQLWGSVRETSETLTNSKNMQGPRLFNFVNVAC